MIRKLIEVSITLAFAALRNELGITNHSIEWAISAFAVKIGPLVTRTRQHSSCRGCMA